MSDKASVPSLDTKSEDDRRDTVATPPKAAEPVVNTAPKGFDLADIDPVAASDKGADIEIVHPASQYGLGMFATILGAESATVRAYAKRKLAAETKKSFQDQRGRRPNPEKLAQETVDRIFDRSSSVDLALVALTGWWRWTDPDAQVLEGQTEEEAKGPKLTTWLFNGEELPFSPENAKRVLTDRPWIASQIDKGTQSLENFFTN